jgi:hypothetical protein
VLVSELEIEADPEASASPPAGAAQALEDAATIEAKASTAA